MGDAERDKDEAVIMMKGLRRHLVAGIAVTAVFLFCALSIGFAGVPAGTGEKAAEPRVSAAAPVPVPDRVTLRGHGEAEAGESVARVEVKAVEPVKIPAVAAPTKTETPVVVVEERFTEAPGGAVESPEPPAAEVPDTGKAAPPSAPPVEQVVVNPPANLTATVVLANPPYVYLKWDANNSRKVYSHFLIYRVVEGEYDGSSEVAPIGETKKDSYQDFYEDGTVVPGTVYRYWVVTVAKKGGVSGPSNPAVVEIPSMEPPAAPQGVIAGAVEAGVVIDWTANTESNLAGYNVYLVAADVKTKLNSAPLVENHYYHAAGVAGNVYAVSAVNVYGFESPATQVVAEATAPVRYEENAASISVEGLWVSEGYPEASGGRILVAGSAGDRLHFKFTGRQVKMYSAMYWSCGSANLYIDNKLVKTVNLYSYDGVFQALVLNVPDLPYGDHVLTVELLGTGNPESSFNFVNVDAFEVW